MALASEDLYFEKLMWFKQNEKPDAVLIVANNLEFINLVIAWTHLEVKRTENLSQPIGDSDFVIWKWLWENAVFSLSDLKTITGVPYSESVLANKIKLLTANRILYPDGTINSFVQRYIREQVVKLFEAKPKKSIRRTND
jgi:hypothetical protein